MPSEHMRFIRVVNTLSVMIPPFAAMRRTGLTTDEGLVQVAKPNRDGQTDILFNGPTPIPAESNGQVLDGLPAVASYSTDNEEGSAPAHGEIWGVKANEWVLFKSQPGFVCAGAGSNGLVNVVEMPKQLLGIVRVTSTVTTAGRYPAKEQDYDPVTKTWADGNDCWYIDANDAVAASARMLAILVGYANGRKVYAASDYDHISSGSGSGDGSTYIDVVTEVCLISGS